MTVKPLNHSPESQANYRAFYINNSNPVTEATGSRTSISPHSTRTWHGGEPAPPDLSDIRTQAFLDTGILPAFVEELGDSSESALDEYDNGVSYEQLERAPTRDDWYDVGYDNVAGRVEIEKREKERLHALTEQLSSMPDSPEKFIRVSAEVRNSGFPAEFAEQLQVLVSQFYFFDRIQESTNSVYLKRLCDWGKSRAAHELFIERYDLFDLDHELTPENILSQYRDFLSDYSYTDQDGEEQFDPPTGIIYKFSDKLKKSYQDNPQMLGIAQHVLDRLTDHPNSLDSDYNAPDPYYSFDESSIYGYGLELELETAHLFGVILDDLDDESREYLFEFGSTVDEKTYVRIKNIVSMLDDSKRTVFAKAFLALEFGEDFGDTLLNIAEYSPETGMEIVEVIANYRKSAEQFSSLFPAEIQESARKALDQRLTELLTLVDESIARGGTLDTKVIGRAVHVENLESLIGSLKILDEAMSNALLITENTSAIRLPESTDYFDMYGYYPEDKALPSMLIYIRPVPGSKGDSKYEHVTRGKGKGASVDMLIGTKPGVKLSPLIAKHEKQGALSIRIDRDGFEPGVSRAEQTKDLARENGQATLDIGSILGPEGSVGREIGLLVASGNTIRSSRLRRYPQLNHNHEPFDHTRYGTIDGFSRLADEVKLHLRLKP